MSFPISLRVVAEPLRISVNTSPAVAGVVDGRVIVLFKHSSSVTSACESSHTLSTKRRK